MHGCRFVFADMLLAGELFQLVLPSAVYNQQTDINEQYDDAQYNKALFVTLYAPINRKYCSGKSNQFAIKTYFTFSVELDFIFSNIGNPFLIKAFR